MHAGPRGEGYGWITALLFARPGQGTPPQRAVRPRAVLWSWLGTGNADVTRLGGGEQ